MPERCSAFFFMQKPPFCHGPGMLHNQPGMLLCRLHSKKWMNIETFADYAGKLTDCEKNDIFPWNVLSYQQDHGA